MNWRENVTTSADLLSFLESKGGFVTSSFYPGFRMEEDASRKDKLDGCRI